MPRLRGREYVTVRDDVDIAALIGDVYGARSRYAREWGLFPSEVTRLAAGKLRRVELGRARLIERDLGPVFAITPDEKSPAA